MCIPSSLIDERPSDIRRCAYHTTNVERWSEFTFPLRSTPPFASYVDLVYLGEHQAIYIYQQGFVSAALPYFTKRVYSYIKR